MSAPHAEPAGEFLRKVLREIGITQSALAVLMDRPPQVISEIVNGKKAITPATALRLEEALGIDAIQWLDIQSRYRLQLARAKRIPKRPNYVAEVWREDEYWVAQIADLGPGANPAMLNRATQALTINDIESQARDLIAIVLGVEEDSFTLTMRLLTEPPARTQG